MSEFNWSESIFVKLISTCHRVVGVRVYHVRSSVSESSLTGSSVSEFSVVWGSFVLESGGSLCQSLLCQIVRVRRVNGNISFSYRVYFQ